MSDDVLLSVVIPCLNEEKTIAICVEKCLASFRELKVRGEVVVVDNGSSDRSPALAAAAGARVVQHDVRGYGARCAAAFTRPGASTSSWAMPTTPTTTPIWAASSPCSTRGPSW